MPRAFKASNGRNDYYRCAIRLPAGGRKWVWGKTKREAEDKAIEEERLLGLGLDANAKTETLSSFMGRFLIFVKPNDDNEYGVSPSVHQDYKYHSEKHIVPALGSKRVREITIRDVDQFLKSKSDSGLAVATVQYMHRVLRRALNFAVDWNVIERNPASARMRTAKRRKPISAKPDQIRFFTPEQSEKFISAVRGDKFEALFITSLTTGARPSELLGLKWSEVNLKAGTLTFMRALHRTKKKKGEEGQTWLLRTTKTTGSRRTITVPDVAVDVLTQQKVEVDQAKKATPETWTDNELVFPSTKGTPLDISNVLHHFQKVCANAELPKLRYYDLRHTHASLLIANGLHPKLIAERLGHSSIKLTMDTYGHLFEGSDREAAKKMDQLFGTKTQGKPTGRKVVLIRKTAI